jgi:hypothetical protein
VSVGGGRGLLRQRQLAAVAGQATLREEVEQSIVALFPAGDGCMGVCRMEAGSARTCPDAVPSCPRALERLDAAAVAPHTSSARWLFCDCAAKRKSAVRVPVRHDRAHLPRMDP